MNVINKSAWIHIVDRKVLMLRAKEKDIPFMPGGKREAGEDDIDCLVREIREELDVDLLPETVEHQFTIRNEAHGQQTPTELVMKCYTAAYEGELVASGEIEEFHWWSTTDADKASLAGKEVLTRLSELDLID